MAKSREQFDQEKVDCVTKFVEDCKKETYAIRQQWRNNFTQFASGSQFPEKEDWQSSFSLGKFESRTRAVQGNIRDILINNADWYDLDPLNGQDERARELEPALKRVLDYYLYRAKFFRNASSYILCSLLGLGRMVVNWKYILVQNPKYMQREAEKQLEETQRELAPVVDNPITPEPVMEDIERSIVEASREIAAEMTGSEDDLLPEEKEKPYIQIGVPALEVVQPENCYWDTNARYMEESPRGAFDTEIHIWELKQLAKQRGSGYLKKNIDKIVVGNRDTQMNTIKSIYGGRMPVASSDLVKLTVYFGPLVVGDQVKKERWGAIIANDSILIKEWSEYPYWEPPGHALTPFIDAAIKEIPFRATGAGVGDNAVKLDRALDSNMNLMNDAMRFNTIGFNIVDYTQLIDKGVLEEGIEPGKIVTVRGEPSKVFTHVNLTNNVERQWDPINQALVESIDENMGQSEIGLGGPTKRSRVTAKETEARMAGSESRTNNLAIDLEQTFLIPFLEKFFARVVQYGLYELSSNPELNYLLTDREKELLSSVGSEERLQIVNTYYRFKVKGFTSKIDDQEFMSKANEILAIYNSGGPLSAETNIKPLFVEMMKRMEIDGNLQEEMMPENEISFVRLETQLLQNGHMIIPAETDTHEMHIQSHTQVMMPTPALQQHVALHQQMMMALQAQAQQGQQLSQGEPQQALPPPEVGGAFG